LYLQVYFVVFPSIYLCNPIFISVTIIILLLPDIDHTKSWIGKSVYPIIANGYRNYGHRTITHSIFFWLVYFFDSLFVEKNFREDYSISTILFFFLFYLIYFLIWFLAGIPLFYPFIKSLCTSLLILKWEFDPELDKKDYSFMFCFLTFFMQDLFANGFGPINNNFNDVKHQIKEYQFQML
jgi:inner membrane protein